MLCADLGAEAAAARAEVQRRQSELDQVTGERDQSRGRAAEAESWAEALGVVSRGVCSGRSPCDRPSRGSSRILGAACLSRRYVLAVLGF